MVRQVSYLIVASAALFVSSAVLAQQPPGPAYGPHMWDGGWHGWFFGPLMMILFFAAAVIVIVFLVRRLGGLGIGGHSESPTVSPLDILKERFARGEIDKEEFEERRRVLGE